MTETRNLGDRWREAQPTKTLTFWSCVATAILTMIIGFTWGGWVTGGTATVMADEAVEEARAELAAVVCVERFLHGPNAAVELAALKKASSWKQGDLIEEGGWATLPGMEEPVENAADLCAEQVIQAQVPATTEEPAENPA